MVTGHVMNQLLLNPNSIHSFPSLCFSLTVTHGHVEVSLGVAHVVADRAGQQSRPARLHSDLTSGSRV